MLRCVVWGVWPPLTVVVPLLLRAPSAPSPPPPPPPLAKSKFPWRSQLVLSFFRLLLLNLFVSYPERGPRGLIHSTTRATTRALAVHHRLNKRLARSLSLSLFLFDLVSGFLLLRLFFIPFNFVCSYKYPIRAGAYALSSRCRRCSPNPVWILIKNLLLQKKEERRTRESSLLVAAALCVLGDSQCPPRVHSQLALLSPRWWRQQQRQRRLLLHLSKWTQWIKGEIQPVATAAAATRHGRS